MLLLAMIATTFVSSTSTVQARVAVRPPTMTAENAAVPGRHTHAGTVPLSVMLQTAYLSPCMGVPKGQLVTMTALQP